MYTTSIRLSGSLIRAIVYSPAGVPVLSSDRFETVTDATMWAAKEALAYDRLMIPAPIPSGNEELPIGHGGRYGVTG